MKAMLLIMYYIHFGFPLRNSCMCVIIS